MDLTLDVEEYKLNIRAAGIIIHEGKVLFHKNTNKDRYALLGGRVEIGESSEETIKREILEETGKQVEVTGYIATIENFFYADESKYHEIMFVYKAEFTDKQDQDIKDTIKNIEGKDYLQYEWLELDRIEEYEIVPKIIKEILKAKEFPVHKINNELK